MSLSIIIPTLDEAAALPGTLDLLAREGLLESAEVLLADGGSADGTAAIAEARGLRVVRGGRAQRAHQLNAGVAASSGAELLFLHADTQLTGAHVAAVRAALESEPELQGGGFFRRFDRPHWFFTLTGWMSDRRSREQGIFLGDQAIFCRRATFEALGGFNESMSVGEDLEFSLRMRERGPVIALGPMLMSSARRFEKRGVIRQTLADRRWCLDFMQQNGWDPDRRTQIRS